MSKLSRFTQLIFGSSAGTGRIAQFGSLAAGSPTTYSGSNVTPSNVQALNNYLQGWDGAIIGNNSPAIQDMNAIQWLVSRQLAYLFQQGIPEWDSGTTYYTGALVNYSGVICQSLVDSNQNNTPNTTAATSYWTPAFITSANIPSNVNLPGKAAQESSKNLIVSNTNATNSLAIIRGTFITSSTPSVYAGEGFSVSYVSTGSWTVTFTSAFNDIPIIVCDCVGTGAFMALSNTVGTGGFTALTFSNGGVAANPNQFSFIAVGQRA